MYFFSPKGDRSNPPRKYLICVCKEVMNEKNFFCSAVQFPYCFKDSKMLGWPLYSFLIPVLIPMLSFTSLVTKPNQYSELLLYQRRADVENTCYDLLQGITSTYQPPFIRPYLSLKCLNCVSQ